MIQRLELLHDGEWVALQLEEGFFPTITERLNAFERGISSPFQQGVRLPVAPNAKYLGQQHHLDVVDGYNVYEVRYILDGALEWIASLLVEGSETVNQSGYYDCNLILNGYSLLIQNKTIRDVCTDVVDVGGANQTEIAENYWATHALEYPAINYKLPTLHNDDFFSETGQGWTGQINGRENGEDRFQINTATVRNAICPQIFHSHVLKQCFAHFGYAVEDEGVLLHPAIKNKLVLGLHSVDEIYTEGRAKFRVENPVLTEVEIFGETQTATFIVFDEEVFNNADAVVLPSNIPFDPLNEMVSVSMQVSVIFGEIEDGECTVQIFGSVDPLPYGDPFLTGDFPNTQTVTSGGLATGYTGIEGGGVGNRYGIHIKTTKPCEILSVEATFNAFGATPFVQIDSAFRIGDCLPSIGIGKYLQYVRNLFGVAIDIDNATRSVRLSFADSALDADVSKDLPTTPLLTQQRTEYKTLQLGYSDDAYTAEINPNFTAAYDLESDLPTPPARNILALVRREQNYYRSTNDPDPLLVVWERVGVKELGAVLVPEVSGAQELETEAIDLGKVLRTIELAIGGQDVLTLQSSAKGTSAAELGKEKPDWPLSTMIWHGMQPGEDEDYPFASVWGYGYSGAWLGDSMALSDLLGEDGSGLVSRLQPRALQIFFPKVVEMEYPVKMVADVKLGDKVRIGSAVLVVKAMTRRVGSVGLELVVV